MRAPGKPWQLALLLAAAPARAAAAPPGRLPPAAAPATLVTHRVWAARAALEDALRAAGWLPLVPACAVWQPPPAPGAGLPAPWASDPDAVWERLNPLTQSVDAVLIWAESAGGGPVADEVAHGWRLGAIARPLLPGAEGAVPLSYDAAAVLGRELAWGLAELHGRIAPWLELRRPPGAIEQLIRPRAWAACLPELDAAPGADAAASACHGPALLPPPLARAGPLADSLVWRVNRPTDCVALTFDACSTFAHGAYSEAVVTALVRAAAPATLFIGGHWAEMHPGTLQALARLPQFEFGNHSYSHPHMVRLPPERQRQELLWTQYLIYALTGEVPRYFRPPYGDVDEVMMAEVAALGMRTVEYDVPAGDADLRVDVARLVDWVVRRASGGSIVVMHMNQPAGKTAAALPAIVAGLRAKALRPCKLSELLDEPPQ